MCQDPVLEKVDSLHTSGRSGFTLNCSQYFVKDGISSDSQSSVCTGITWRGY